MGRYFVDTPPIQGKWFLAAAKIESGTSWAHHISQTWQEQLKSCESSLTLSPLSLSQWGQWVLAFTQLLGWFLSQLPRTTAAAMERFLEDVRIATSQNGKYQAPAKHAGYHLEALALDLGVQPPPTSHSSAPTSLCLAFCSLLIFTCS